MGRWELSTGDPLGSGAAQQPYRLSTGYPAGVRGGTTNQRHDIATLEAAAIGSTVLSDIYANPGHHVYSTARSVCQTGI